MKFENPAMSEASVSLLVIDDDPANTKLIEKLLSDVPGLCVASCLDPEKGLQLAQETRPDIILVDLMMPKIDGMEVLKRVSNTLPETEVILMTGHYSTQSAVEAIRLGAFDYLEKPLSLGRLQQSVGRCAGEARMRRRAASLDEEISEAFRLDGMVGRSPAILEVFARLKRVAPHFQTVLISGASGTGKELVARALHRLSPVGENKLAVCNCSAIVETLFESELFGHVKGAFTGAFQDKIGLFEYANGGTVFLDEIGEMPLTTQAKLLRVLQSQEIQRVGSPVVRRVNIKVIAATNRDLRAEVEAKRFREDLYYRLTMVEVQLPTLRERLEDLPLLLRSFIARFAKQYDKEIHGVTLRAQSALSRYSWPGNVRELENAVGHACMMASKPKLDVDDFPRSICSPVTSLVEQDWPTLEELELRYVQRVMNHVKGNKAEATRILGIGRTTLYRLLQNGEKHGEEPMRKAEGLASPSGGCNVN